MSTSDEVTTNVVFSTGMTVNYIGKTCAQPLLQFSLHSVIVWTTLTWQYSVLKPTNVILTEVTWNY